MSFHTAAFFASVVTAVETVLPPVQDDILNIQNGRFLPSRTRDLIYAAAMSTDLQRAFFTSPKLRQITLPFIRPIIDGAVPFSLNEVADYRKNPLSFPGVEEFSVSALNDAAVGPEDTTVVFGMSEGFTPMIRGDIFTMRGTGTTTTIANAWTTCPITFADTLPVGDYAVVGLEAIGVTCQAARLIFGGQEIRPGCLGQIDDGGTGPKMFRKGGLGEWGRFNTIDLPQVQFLTGGIDTVQEIYMDIIRVR